MSIIIGIDPGTVVTGYGIIAVSKHNEYVAIDYGCIRPPTGMLLSDRYHIIFLSISTLLEKYHPNVMALETQYVHKNVQSAIKLGMSRGVAIVAAKQKNLDVFEYSPTKAKLAVVGNGKANKQQVQGMIKQLLRLSMSPPEDAADALALAICHEHTSRKAVTTKSKI